ncbi:MAG: EndoU domain-containing protein, partial [Chlamydiales bacterium]|nr:EndoU domain-containing protein [Chlamydiales bacterium]
SKQDKAFSYTARGFLTDGTFDVNATRTQCENHTILDNGVDSFGKVTAELLDQKKIYSSYNAMGELTSSNSEKYRWDPWGQLLEVTTSSSKWTAVYDAFGRRLETAHTKLGYIYSPTTVTTSFFDPEKEFEEIGIHLHDKTFWKYFGPKDCDAVSDNTGQTAYLIHNCLQQLEAVVTNNTVSYPDNYPTPYGPQKQPDAFYDLVTYAKSLSWHSQAQDPTGLIWMGKRYYDQQFGRLISCDPIGLPATTNLYTYANGDPINYTDPDGRFASPVYNPVPQTTIHTTEGSPSFWQSVKNSSSHYFNKAWAACTVDNTLDAMDQVSLALMLIPSGHVKLAGASIGAISNAARFTRGIFSKPVRNAAKPIAEFGVNHIVRSSPQAHKAAKATMDVAKKAWQFDKDYVNLASDTATHHIIFGEGAGFGGHLWPGAKNKSPFPANWSPGKIMDIVSDIATDPLLTWKPSSKINDLGRFVVHGIREDVKIRVIIEQGADLVSAYPVKSY